jgi:hypothetical protein
MEVYISDYNVFSRYSYGLSEYCKSILILLLWVAKIYILVYDVFNLAILDY